MSDALLVTLCFDFKYQTPSLKNVLSFFSALQVKKLDLIKYNENKIAKRIDNANVPILCRDLNVNTKDFHFRYEWKEEESNLIIECAAEIRKHIESDIDHYFYFFSLGVQSGDYFEKNNEVFEEVKDKASNFIIYFYTEVTDIIHFKVNFEENLRNTPKVQKLISIIEKELGTKVIKIGVEYSH